MTATSKRWVIVAVLIVATLGMSTSWAWQLMRRTAQSSSVSAVSAQIMTKLPTFYEKNGHYPKSLEELGLNLADADGATDETLRFVRYSSDGSSFTYAEVGPDEYHRRVWWCVGSGPAALPTFAERRDETHA